MRSVPLALAALLVLPGCVSLLREPDPCPTPTTMVLTGPYDSQERLPVESPRRDDGYPRILVASRNDAASNATLSFGLFPEGRNVGSFASSPINATRANYSVPPHGTQMGAITPLFAADERAPDGRWLYTARSSLHPQDPRPCHGPDAVEERLEFVASTGATAAHPGIGVLVSTAGFWTNGTLFYTNMDRVNNDTRIAKGGWYEFEGHDPLKVYVYNETRTEIPPRYNQSGFYTTIPGFNAALKTIDTHTGRVAILTPQEGYTRDGNERHPLYGDALVFYLEIHSTVSLPCPYPQPVCELPTPAAPIPYRDPYPGAPMFAIQ